MIQSYRPQVRNGRLHGCYGNFRRFWPKKEAKDSCSDRASNAAATPKAVAIPDR